MKHDKIGAGGRSMKHDKIATAFLLVMALLVIPLSLMFSDEVVVPDTGVPVWALVAGMVFFVVAGAFFWILVMKKSIPSMVRVGFAVLMSLTLLRMLSDYSPWFELAVYVVMVVTLVSAFTVVSLVWNDKKRKGDWWFVRFALPMVSVVFLFVSAWVGAVVARVLGLGWTLAFFALAAVYDWLAVRRTGHMVEMAKGFIEAGVFPGIAWAKRKWKQVAFLGGGDLLFLGAVSTAFFLDGGFSMALMAGGGLMAGLVYLFFLGEPKRHYPALPYMLAGLVVAWAGNVVWRLIV